MINYLGDVSLAAFVPLLGTTLSALIAELDVQVTALLSAGISLDLGGIDVQLDLAAKILVALEAALALGIQLPSINFQLTAVLDLQLKLKLLLALRDQLATTGLHAYTFRGRVSNFGGELATAIAGTPMIAPSDIGAGVALLATAPGAVETIANLFKG